MVPDRALPQFDTANFSIAHMDDAIRDSGCLGIMGDHQYRLFELLVGTPQHLENGVGIFRVEVSGRLVCKHDGGARDERAGNSNALLFSAGEFRGAMVESARDVQQPGEMGEKLLVDRFGAGRDLVSDLDIAARGKRGEQIEFLKDEADARAAHAGALSIAEVGEVDAADENFATGGASEATEQDLPEPEGPTIDTNSPASTSKVASRSAGTSSLPER
jgi:hypothetical protein